MAVESFEDRKSFFEKGLAQLIRETNVQPIPTMHYGLGGAIAQIMLIDLNNEEMLKKYGLVKVKKTNADTDTPPSNPRVD